MTRIKVTTIAGPILSADIGSGLATEELWTAVIEDGHVSIPRREHRAGGDVEYVEIVPLGQIVSLAVIG